LGKANEICFRHQQTSREISAPAVTRFFSSALHFMINAKLQRSKIKFSFFLVWKIHLFSGWQFFFLGGGGFKARVF
jgi:hypothetical protein